MKLPDLTLTIHESDPDGGLLDFVLPLYEEVYAEPPYNEGPDEFESFAAGWPSFASRPGFRLVVARAADERIGFAFGIPLQPNTQWWSGLLDPAPQSVTREWKGRTFAVIELAVQHIHRRHGIGRALHHALLANRPEERATLLVRPEAQAALCAYTSWGYQQVGRLRPYPEAPMYVAMIRDLPLGGSGKPEMWHQHHASGRRA